MDTRITSGWNARGQSLVEFALVLPLLLVLLLGIADFGRVFAAGITMEAAARDGAEAAAVERLRTTALVPGDPDYYTRLHEIAARVACTEARSLANTTFFEPDRSCAQQPAVAVCVRDGLDPDCGGLAPGYVGPLPAECSDIAAPWDPGSGGALASHSVEVRTCYHFTTLFNLHLSLPFGSSLSLGDIWLQRSRTFLVDCPPGDVSTC